MPTLVLYFSIITMAMWSSDAYKALVVFPMPSRSHGYLGDAVVKQLLKEGHEVTYICCFKRKNAPPSLRQIVVSKATEFMMNSTHLDIKKILDNKTTFNDINIIRTFMITLMIQSVELEEVQKLLGDRKEQFDVVIVEWMFSELLSGLAAVYDCPLIWMSPLEVNNGIMSLIDAPPNPAYNADMLSSNVVPFTFSQRFKELWTQIKIKYMNYIYYNPIESEEYTKLIAPHIIRRGRQPPPYLQVKYNASLVIGNSHVAMGEATSLPQSYKHIGGYHIEENVKPLPEDLKKIIEGAKHGVIYFSMGSSLKSKDWPDEIKQSLLKMFGELKQTVLWKFEEDLPNVPKNVHILKWAPQATHKNCLLFISQGGLLSTTETIHFGVPIIGIPVFGDQFMNVKKAVYKGFALQVDLTFNIAQDLKVAIGEMLSNPKYVNKVKELSFIYHDRPMKPAQELGHWVRHVIETRGAGHLRSPAIDIPLYQRLYLDLLGIILVILILFIYFLRSVCSLIYPKEDLINLKKNN